LAVGFVLALAATAVADPAPKAVDIKPFKDKLVILKDAEGGWYAVTNEKGGEPRIFYGTSPKTFHEALYEGSRSRDGDGWSVSVQAPRTEFPFMGHIERKKDGGYRATCGDKKTIELTEVTGDKAKEILDKSSFMTTQMVRKPYLIARDDRGVYYYVDVIRDIYGGGGHRVFVGKRGALKQLPLTDIASDSAGDVFATKTGDLRLVRTFDKENSKEKFTAQWIRGEKTNELIYLDIYMNQPLIWRDLGVYKVFGTICGNI